MIHVCNDTHGADVIRLVHDRSHLIHCEVRHGGKVEIGAMGNGGWRVFPVDFSPSKIRPLKSCQRREWKVIKEVWHNNSIELPNEFVDKYVFN